MLVSSCQKMSNLDKYCWTVEYGSDYGGVLKYKQKY